MSIELQKETVRDWYESLAKMDEERFYGAQTDDVIYNVNGSTAVSGRWQGKEHLKNRIMPAILAGLNPGEFQFAKRWKIVCADEKRVVAVMEGEGLARDGRRYDNRYCQIFEFRDDKICEVWEFFDTALAETVLFGNELTKPYEMPADHERVVLPRGLDE